MNQVIKTKAKEYNRPVSATWWMKRPSYTRFIIRELTGIVLAGYAVFLIYLMMQAKDPARFNAMIESLKSPLNIGLHLIVLFFALFHSITFFDLTPRALRVHRGEARVPDGAIAGAHYAAWAVASIIVLFLVARR
jgi:fumarate reductase subunit C